MQNINNEFVSELGNFNNIVIYGHSLHKQDFSFFFPIFDYLKLNNVSKSSKITFAYSIFDNSMKDTIITKHTMGISDLITKYENYIYPKREECRLLDSLSMQGRIISREI